MRNRRRRHVLAILLAILGLAVASSAWRAETAAALDATPATPVYLPIVRNPPPPIYLPLMSLGEPAPSFLAVNGGPIDGGAGTGAYEGDLAYFPTLRSKSFDWMNVAGLGWYRNYGSDAIVYSWRFVEPSPGVYDWSFWDELVRQAQAHHITLLASIGDSVPQWANGTSDWRQPPSDLFGSPMQSTAWYQYVYNFVDRYNGDGHNDMPGLTQPIKNWEFWNEPDLREGWNPPNYPAHEFNGNVTDYVRLRSVAYTAVKTADPTATVVGPATAQTVGYGSQYVGSTHWFMWSWPEFVAAGGLNTLDVVSFTHYFSQNNWDITGYDEPDFILNMVNSGRGGKPVWITETGWSGSPATNYQEKARSLVRLAMILWSTPWMERMFWYDFQEQSLIPSSYHRGLIQTQTGPGASGVEPDPLFHPAFRTAELMQRILAGFNSGNHPAAVNVGGSARAYHFSAPGKEVWVAWLRNESGSGSVSLNTAGRVVRVIGLYGQDLGLFSGGSLTVGPDPVYLTTDLNWNQNVGRIAGRLQDGGQPHVLTNGVAGATVIISGPNNLSDSAQTDADGNYSFSDLPDGNYHVAVQGLSSSPPSYDLAVGRQIFWGQTSFTVTVSAR